ncbi:MAG: hypothetical protein J6K29_11650 [Clostridia bacterium]|nr:hypothetical protein [Clostridia bacterium]
MKSTITAHYYGNPPPYERKPPQPAEGDRLYEKVKRKREVLMAAMPTEQRALLEAYDTALDILAEERQRERFAEGFRVGLRLGAECFGE